jgi:Tfp pilus assembly protein PilV
MTRLRRIRAEDGFGLIELTVAMFVLSIALLTLMAAFDTAAVSLHSSAQKTTAAQLGESQLELYRALPYAQIGLDQATVDAIGTAGPSYDALYSTNSILDGTVDNTTTPPTVNPSGTVNDVAIVGCGSTPQCLPIQTVTGSDHRSYRIETFVVDVENNPSIRWTERVVTVIVRDASASGMPEIAELSTAFDRGPSS